MGQSIISKQRAIIDVRQGISVNRPKAGANETFN